jgi:hypothetical protein
MLNHAIQLKSQRSKGFTEQQRRSMKSQQIGQFDASGDKQ